MKNHEGRQLVGWPAVAMLAMGTSGLVNWWPRGNQWRGAFSVSKQACGFRLHREAHGAVGIWGLAVFLMVSFAGVYLAFPETVRSVIDLVLPVRDLRAGAAAVRVEPIAGTEPLGIDGAIELARSSMPGTGLGFAFLPTQHDRPFRIGLVRPDQERRAAGSHHLCRPVGATGDRGVRPASVQCSRENPDLAACRPCRTRSRLGMEDHGVFVQASAAALRRLRDNHVAAQRRAPDVARRRPRSRSRSGRYGSEAGE